MSRFIAIYRRPASDEAAESFEKAYRDTHLPLVDATPGVVSTEVVRARKTLVGDPLLLVATIHFSDADAMKQGLASPEWAEAGKNLAEIGGLALATLSVMED